MADEVQGIKPLIATLGRISQETLRKAREIVGKNSVRAANHAKEDHSKGMAHAIGRYENQTSNLTNDIRVHGPFETQDSIEGVVATSKEYAPKVEFGGSRSKAFPFMGPALHAVEPKFMADMRNLKVGNA